MFILCDDFFWVDQPTSQCRWNKCRPWRSGISNDQFVVSCLKYDFNKNANQLVDAASINISSNFHSVRYLILMFRLKGSLFCVFRSKQESRLWMNINPFYQTLDSFDCSISIRNNWAMWFLIDGPKQIAQNSSTLWNSITSCADEKKRAASPTFLISFTFCFSHFQSKSNIQIFDTFILIVTSNFEPEKGTTWKKKKKNKNRSFEDTGM